MLLRVKNVGMIESASIELNGITVIAGLNNTGKSTVGKMLFCIFNSFFRINEQIETERRSLVNRVLTRALYEDSDHEYREFDIDGVARTIIKGENEAMGDSISFQNYITGLLTRNDAELEKYVSQIKMDELAEITMNILNVSDEEILANILHKKLIAEFNMQINSIHFPRKMSEITLTIKNVEMMIKIKNNKDLSISNSMSLNTEAIYFDDPYALDDLRNIQPRSNQTHRAQLRRCLLRESTTSVKDTLIEIITSKKLERVFEKLDSVCPGELVRKPNRTFAYGEGKAKTMIDIVNVSAGLKTFAIIKTLLLNGSLEENGTIILDEPEIHLHPEWQLVFAELIVLIQKEFKMHILINTHSPYFLYALEVYSYRHGITDKCKYYLTEVNGSTSAILDVSANIESIYKILGRPFQDLENERFSDD